ncbi:MAG TPA: hypothetical protein VK502_01085 [Candidatus Saccharimonadales bacterium]|nr:hypothetical protein [Candidatus Saccharimonadales bacterium]
MMESVKNRIKNQTWFLLLKTWGSSHFWASNKIQVVFLAIVILFWWRQTEGVLHNVAPLAGWVISAGLAVCLLATIAWEGFRLARGNASAMAVLQFLIIIAGNSLVLVLMIARGIDFKPPDMVIFAVGATGGGVIASFIVRKKFGWKSAWAKCWYSVSLKAAPQVVQAYWLLVGMGSLDAWSVVFLVLQGVGRFMLAQKEWSESQEGSHERRNNAQALRVGTGLDLVTIIFVAIGAVINAAS